MKRRNRFRARVRHHAGVIADGFWAHPFSWIYCAWIRFDGSRSLGLAAEMAFWLFLSLLPLAAVAGLVTARLAVGNIALAAPLLGSLPRATRELVTGEISRMAAWNGGQVGIWAGVMFVWLASSGVHSIFDGIEVTLALGIPRPWWKKRVLAVATCVALSLGTSLVTLLGTGLGWLWRIAGPDAPSEALALESSAALGAVRLVLGAALAIGLVCALFRVAQPPGVPKPLPILPGALLAVALHVTLAFAYAFYLKQAGDGGPYLAGLASIGVTLIALYLFCLVLLGGIQVNLMLGERRRGQILSRARTLSRGEAPPPS